MFVVAFVFVVYVWLCCVCGCDGVVFELCLSCVWLVCVVFVLCYASVVRVSWLCCVCGVCVAFVVFALCVLRCVLCLRCVVLVLVLVLV